MICLDNMVLAWGLADRATSGQEGMIELTRAYLEDLEKKGKRVVIPAPALCEFLVPVPKEQHLDMLKKFARNFVVMTSTSRPRLEQQR